MSYIRPSDGPPISHETLGMLARLAGITLRDGDLEPLATALRDQLASIEEIVALDLTDVDPAGAFDAAWDD
jgi:Asp-tRNA(Asn)/Glu-tRNA(Gln) amidotransferase C subunit